MNFVIGSLKKETLSNCMVRKGYTHCLSDLKNVGGLREDDNIFIRESG